MTGKARKRNQSRRQAMFMHRIELMGPEYVLLLGAWWGAAMLLMVLSIAVKRAFAGRNKHRLAGRWARTSMSGSPDQ